MPVRLFISYSRSDDEAFVRRLYGSLKVAGFDVWFDRVSMPSRELTFSKEIEDAISICDRLVFIIGPSAVSSDYVSHEWRFAFHQAVKCVNPILRLGDYDIIPEDLRGPHIEDFRDNSAFDFHLANLVRQLSDPLPPLGKLVAVPALPPHYLEQGDRIRSLRDLVLADLQKPIVVSGASGRVGLHGMGGIGKSLLANALARRPEIRREFPDGVFWVTLGQQPLIVELQRNIAKELGDEALFTTAHEGRERLRELLKERAALLVLDDAWQREHADAFNVIGPQCRLLLTTRDAGLVTALAAKENHYQVQLPTEAEARAMLAGAADIPVEKLPMEAREIVAECERLPLALALCGGMVHGGTSWADLLEALREHDLRFLSDAHPGEEQHANVWKAIDVSVRVLPEAERKRFAELAVFALDTGAPEAAVETLWEHTAGLAPRYARKVLRDFAGRSLLQMDAARMKMHDLVHDFATGMTADATTLHQALLDAYSKKCPSGWASGPNDGYFFERLPYHLGTAARHGDLQSLLLDPRWLQAKMQATGIYELLHDYLAFDTKVSSEVLLSGDGTGKRQVSGVYRLLDRNSNTLGVDPSTLAQCLYNSLVWEFDASTELGRNLRTLGEYPVSPWLRLRRPVADDRNTPALLLRTLKGHDSWNGTTYGKVHSVAFSPDGSLLATGSQDHTVGLWETNTGKLRSFLLGHESTVHSVAFSPNGRYLVSAGDDAVRLWDLNDAHQSHAIISKGSRSATFSQDGSFLASIHGDSVILLDVITKSLTATLVVGERSMRAFAFSPSQRHIVTVSNDFITISTPIPNGVSITSEGSTDMHLRLWEIPSATLLAVQRPDQLGPGRSVAFSPDGTLIASTHGGTLAIRDATTLALQNSVQSSFPHDDRPWAFDSIAFSNDGQIVARSDGSAVELWDVANGATRGALLLVDDLAQTEGSIAFSLDGRYLASAHDCTARLWDMTRLVGTSVVSERITTSDDLPVATLLSNEGRLIAEMYCDEIRVWNLEHGGEQVSLKSTGKGRRSIRFSRDCELIAETAAEAYTIALWETDSGRRQQVIHLRTPPASSQYDPVVSIAFSPDRRALAVGSTSKLLELWDLQSSKLMHVLDGHRYPIWAVDYSSSGELLSSIDLEGSVLLWNLMAGRLIGRVHLDHSMASGRSLCFSPKGDRIAYTTGTGVVLINFRGGETRKFETSGWVNSICFDCDGRLLAAASGADLIVWDASTGKQAAMLKTQATIQTIAFDPFWKDSSIGIYFAQSNRMGRSIPTVNVTDFIAPPEYLFSCTEETWPGLIGSVEQACEPCEGNFGSALKFEIDAGSPFGGSFVSSPHPASNPELAAQLNIQYQRERRAWEALPWWKRIRARKPEPPTGI